MIGAPVPRLEDLALVRGAGRYTDDGRTAGDAVLVFLRSDRPSGRIVALDTAAALACPGVIGIVTVADLVAAGCRPLAPRQTPTTADGRPVHVPPFPGLADGAVRHVGEPILAVVAETEAAARDGAEAVVLSFADAPFVLDPLAARTGPPVWPSSPDNRIFVHELGDHAAVDAALAAAPRRVARRLVISRVAAAPMEPRNAVVAFDPATASYTVRTGTQTPHGLAAGLATLLAVPPGAVRVVSEACGGSFGMRNGPSPELLVLAVAARRFGRPVRWCETRAEAFLADPQAREQVVDVTLALDDAGRFLALKVEAVVAVGAYVGPSSLHPATGNLGSLAGVYRTPAIHARVEAVHVNTQTVAPYRGAGRPEATYVLERIIDIAAGELGLDRAEIRQRNLIPPAAMPYRTPLTFTYDCGDFPAVLARALAAADWAGFPARRQEAAARGRLRGIGIACSTEIAGGPVAGPLPDYARLEIGANGAVLRLGSGDSGQGHATTLAQVLAATLGPVGPLRVVAGDTAAVARGTGSFGSRSAAAVGTAVRVVSEAVRDRLHPEAADHLEAALSDVVFADGAFRIAGTDRAITVADLVVARDLAVAEERFLSTAGPTFPNGCHIAEVEIDPDTGALAIVHYLVVDDVGTAINPLLVAGQIHGGVAQGIGQALMEAIRHDPNSGQVLTGSFMDYAMPRAADLSAITVETHPVPTAANPLGVKGAGEAGVVGALPVMISAVSDALAPLGIDHIDMPATPARIWAAIAAAR